MFSSAGSFRDVKEDELKEEEQKIKDEPKRVNFQEAEVRELYSLPGSKWQLDMSKGWPNCMGARSFWDCHKGIHCKWLFWLRAVFVSSIPSNMAARCPETAQ